MEEKPKLYRVDRVIPRTDLTLAGTFEFKHEIFFTTVSGVSDSVMVPKDMPPAERDKVLTEAATRIEETIKLRR